MKSILINGSNTWIPILVLPVTNIYACELFVDKVH